MRTLLLMSAICFVLFVGGCSSNDGPMTKSEVVATLKDELKLKEVSLSEQPDGSYSGKGIRADGSKYTIVVTLKQDQRSLSYTATSERGELEAGSVRQFGPRWLQTANSARKVVLFVLLLIAAIGGASVVVKRMMGKSTV